jgi:hypothetical protein
MDFDEKRIHGFDWWGGRKSYRYVEAGFFNPKNPDIS